MEKIRNYLDRSNIDIITSTEKYWIHYTDTTRLDIQCGNGAFIFGYSDREILDAIKNTDIMFVRSGCDESDEITEALAEKLLKKSGMAGLSWAVSGSDGVEAAIAMNDQYWKKTNPSKRKIISIRQGYSGTTYLLKSLRDDEHLDRCITIDTEDWISYDQRSDVEAKLLNNISTELDLHRSVGCMVIESIPWINGFLPWSLDFWQRIRKICDEHDVNLLIDDVAGYGKLGESFGHLNFFIKPDIVAIGKSFTGGYVPLSAAFCNDKIFTILQSKWDHSHTWNPNSMGIRSADKVFDKMEVDLSTRIQHVSTQAKQLFETFPITTVRGQGLFVEIVLDDIVDNYFLKKLGFTFNITGDRSIKFCIPLIADADYFQFIEQVLGKVFK